MNSSAGDPAPGEPGLDRARMEIGAEFAELLRDDRRRDLDQLLASAVQSVPAEVIEAQTDPQRRLGKYVLLRPIGRGAMAAVWKSWDRELGRWVAVKVLQDPDAASHRQRFLREAQAAANLRHPNIVTVHDAGEVDGRLFLVMELIDGRPLDVRDSIDRVVGALIKIAGALEEAHQKGVIHRDIKPGNIMVDAAGEPHVVDFGLAHLQGDHLRITRSGAAVGTPVYMAPEQVSGRMDAIGPATDVYALGAILYEALAGRPPYMGESATEIYGRILSDDPVAPSSLNEKAPRDLETIALKALDKDPARRYVTAAAFAEDLAHYRAGEPILARRQTIFHRCRRWVVKRRAVVAAALIGIAVVLPVTGVMMSKLSRAGMTLDLWSRISSLLADADRLARAGEMERAGSILDEGIAVCRSHLEKNEFAHGRYFLGRFLRARGRADEAERELSRALELDPSLGEARQERGLLRADRYMAQLAFYRHFVSLEEGDGSGANPAPPDEVERRHPALRSIREAVVEDLSAAGGKSSFFREIDGLYARAVFLTAQDQLGEARRMLEQVTTLDPSHAEARLTLAYVDGWRLDWDAMVGQLDRAIELHKGLVNARRMRSSVFRSRAAASAPGSEERRRWGGKALEDANVAVRLDDGDGESSMQRAEAHLSLGEMSEAIEDYTASMSKSAMPVFPLVSRGLARLRNGDHDGGIRDIEEAIKLAPDLPSLVGYRGLARKDRGDFEGAMRDFDAVIARKPEMASAWGNRGLLRMLREDLDGAIEDMTRCIDLAPTRADSHHNRGNAWLRKGEPDRALADYSKAIEIQPALAAARFARAGILSRRRDFEGAIRDLAVVIKVTPDDVRAWVNRGMDRRNLFLQASRQGQPGKAAAARAGAIEDFEEAQRLGIKAPDVRGIVEEALLELRTVAQEH